MLEKSLRDLPYEEWLRALIVIREDLVYQSFHGLIDVNPSICSHLH